MRPTNSRPVILSAITGFLKSEIESPNYQPNAIEVTVEYLKERGFVPGINPNTNKPYLLDKNTCHQFEYLENGQGVAFINPQTGKFYAAQGVSGKKTSVPKGFPQNAATSKILDSFKAECGLSTLAANDLSTDELEEEFSPPPGSPSPGLVGTNSTKSPSYSITSVGGNQTVTGSPLSKKQKALVEKYLSKEPLSQSEKEEIKEIPLSSWISITEDPTFQQSPAVKCFALPNTLVKVTLFLKNEFVKVLPIMTLNTVNDASTKVELASGGSNSQVQKLTLNFVVTKNNGNVSWVDLLTQLKELLFSTSLAYVLPECVFLDSVTVSMFNEKQGLDDYKTLTWLEAGKIKNEKQAFSNKLFCINMFSKMLQTERNEFQIRLPWLAESVEKDPVSAITKGGINAFVSNLKSPLQIKDSKGVDSLTLKFIIITTRKNAVYPYWPVDDLFPAGFVAPRSFKTQNGLFSLKEEGGNP